MNYYKDENDSIFAYDDEQEKLAGIKAKISGLTPITEEEMRALTYVEPVIDPKAAGDVYTLNGEDFLIPFTKEDADGMVQVTLALMKEAITETTIHFSNGTKLPVQASDFDAFALWFAQKRNSFFVKSV